MSKSQQALCSPFSDAHYEAIAQSVAHITDAIRHCDQYRQKELIALLAKLLEPLAVVMERISDVSP